MSTGPVQAVEQSPIVVRAELALQALRQHLVSHLNRESQLCRSYGEWQENWLSRAEQLRRQVGELEARLAPWMPRGESPRLAVVFRNEEAASK